jgi:sugar lactone lactonase YvrE
MNTLRTTWLRAVAGGMLALGACTNETDVPPDEPVDEPACEGKGVICSYLGNGEAGLGEDGMPPLEVSLYLPQDLTFGPDGRPYIVDWNNHRIRTIDEDGHVQTVIGTGYLGDATDGPAREVSLNHPTHIAFDDQGRMLISAWHNSKVMRYDPDTEELQTLCGTGGRDYGGDGGPADKAILDLPVATAFDGQGRMLIMDQANQRIRRVDEQGMIDTVVGPSKDLMPVPAGLARVCATNAMGVEQCKLCREAEAEDPMCAARKPQGFAGDGGPGTEALIFLQFGQQGYPSGRMEMGPDGTLYFCDTGNNRVRALSEDGIVTTVAGSGPDEFDPAFAGGYEGDGGPATEALLRGPRDLAVAPSGQLYIADTFNSCVRKVDEGGEISTVAGKCGERGFEGDGGRADDALLNRPYGVALDEDGNLYIADTHNQRIRVVYGVE